MWSYVVVPVEEVFFIGKGVPVSVIYVKPSLYFSIALRMLNPTEDLLDSS